MKTFIVDAMLGKLATWLRLTGYDTFYSTKVHDDELLRIAKEQNRILLTSDAILSTRASNEGIETMLVRGSVDEEVASVFLKYGIEPKADPAISRCTKCNGDLIHVEGTEKAQIKDLVPDQTYNYYQEFWYCKYCKSVFFQGGQWTNIDDYMVRIADLMEELKS
ncbi:MAG: Mut7-C RNAse domain-containing protein [Candidatus Thorarchaeota archaeon]|nr:Mut7-C RNAse domain-containing protein [Candidatus Thorarchaeota archaeon]